MGRWAKIHAGFYERIGSDGSTVLAKVARQDDGKWSYTVRPFGRMELGWEITGKATMDEAKRAAEGGYRSYMQKHAEANKEN